MKRRTGSAIRVDSAATTMPDRNTEELEFSLILAGTAKYFVDNEDHNLAAGTLVWLVPGQARLLTASSNLEMWIVSTMQPPWDAALLAGVAAFPARTLVPADAAALDRQLAAALSDDNEPEPFDTQLAHILRFAARASIYSAERRHDPLHQAVLRALSMMRNMAAIPSLEELASACGMSRNYLARLLIDHTGSGYSGWRNRARLERFHAVFPQSDGLLAAALSADFGSYAQFHRVFLELIGCTPGEWTKAGANADQIAAASMSCAMSRLDDAYHLNGDALAGVVLPRVGRWLDDDFRRRLVSTIPRPASPASTTYVRTDADIALVRTSIVEELHLIDPVGASLLAQAYQRHDLAKAFQSAFGASDLDLSDVADVMAAYLSIAWASANKVGSPSLHQIAAARMRIRRALAATPAFVAASNSDRQTVTETLLAHAVFASQALRNSQLGGDPAELDRWSDLARQGALRIFGIDPRTTRLDF